jgi:putative DNA primase/helicase
MKQHNEERERRRVEAEQRARELSAKAATKAQAIWQDAAPAPQDHPYLQAKQVKAHGIRYATTVTLDFIDDETGEVREYTVRDALLIAAMKDARTIASLQVITGDGKKRFMLDGEMAGSYAKIGAVGFDTPRIIITEGYATGASIFEGTSTPVVLAFNAGNLPAVAAKMRAALPNVEIIIAADNDQYGRDNAGVRFATQAAEQVGGRVLTPSFDTDVDHPTDWNDFACLYGLDALRAVFADEEPPPPVSNVEPIVRPEVSKPTLRVIEGNTIREVELSPEAFPPEYSDDSLAMAFTKEYGTDFRYVAQWGRWMRWTGTHWDYDSTLHVFDLARQVCRRMSMHAERDPELTPSQQARIASHLASSKTVAAVEKLAKADRMHAATIEQWDADPWLLNTPGGTVDLRTGKMRGHNPLDYITKCTTATPGGECPAWLTFVDRVTGGDQELQAFLRRFIGYSLTGVIREHALGFFYGTGGNGKGTFLNTITSILGEYGCVAGMDVFTESRGDRHTTEIARLRGARLVTAQETEEGKRWAESRIKALTGGDPITARFMRQDDFTFLPQFKLLIAGNHKPGLRNVDEAMRRRFHLIPFTQTITAEERDPMLPDKLRAEHGAILQWAVDGCIEWQRTGLAAPESVHAATDEYLVSEDSTQAWLDDCCKVGVNYSCLSSEAYASFKKWADENGEYCPPQKRFLANLESRSFFRKKGTGGVRLIMGFQIVQTESGGSDFARY